MRLKVSANTILLVILLIYSGCFLYKGLIYHYQIITYPYLHEYREMGMILSTDKLAHFQNPYSYENQPLYHNPYGGIIYHMINVPLVWIFKNSLLVHRLVSGIFMLLSCLLIYKFINKQTKNIGIALASATTLYLSLLFLTTPLPRPDSTGLFFFLIATLYPISENYTKKSLWISIITGLLAIYCKIYFIIGLFSIGVCLFIVKSKRQAIYFGIVVIGLVFISGVLVTLLFPTYFISSFFIISCDINQSILHLNIQLQRLTQIEHPGLFVLFILAVFYNLFIISKNLFKQRKIELFPKLLNFDNPLINIKDISFSIVLCALVSFCVFYFKMGTHLGAYMIYALELVVPFILIFSVITISKSRLGIYICSILLMCNLNYAYKFIYSLGGLTMSSTQTAQWIRAEELIKEHNNILNSPAIASILFAQNKPIYDSGTSGLYYACLSKPPSPMLNKYDIAHKNYVAALIEGINNKEYDLIMLETWQKWTVSNELIARNYFIYETLSLYMPHSGEFWNINVWKPKKGF